MRAYFGVICVIIAFAPIWGKSSKSIFKEFTNQEGVLIKDGSKV